MATRLETKLTDNLLNPCRKMRSLGDSLSDYVKGALPAGETELLRKGKRKMTNRSLFQSGGIIETCFTAIIITIAIVVSTVPAFAADELMIIGHERPDVDTVTSAIAYANLKNMMGVKEAFPAVAGDLNNCLLYTSDAADE